MSLAGTGSVRWVEAASVVNDGQRKGASVEFAGDGDTLRVAVTNGVDRGFADDAQGGMAERFRQTRRGDVDVDGEGASAQMGRKRLADGVGKRLRIERVAPEIPQTASELTSAGGEDSLGGTDFAGIKLHGRAGEDLRDRVVKFDGKTCPLLGLQFGEGVRRPFAEEFASAPFG